METVKIAGRNVTFITLGIIAMFIAQPWIYRSDIVPIAGDTDDWISKVYFPRAFIVFIFSVLATMTWHIMGNTSKVLSARQVNRYKIIWRLLFLAPILGIMCALVFIRPTMDIYGNIPDDQVYITVLFAIDILLLFWLPTATGSPKSVKFVPFGSFFFRRLID